MPKFAAKVHPYTVICGSVALLLTISTLGMVFRPPSASDFRFRRSRYEQIIARVKAIGIEPNGGRYLWTSPDLDPASLSHKRLNDADMVGMVEAYRDESTGAYTVIITTLDRGHSGTFGYGYSETPNSFPPPGTYWRCERRIDAHWCIAANRSW